MISQVVFHSEEVGDVYIVPKQGGRFSLSSLVRDMPIDVGKLGGVVNINDQGAITGVAWIGKTMSLIYICINLDAGENK